jgi:hypothetical protein
MRDQEVLERPTAILVGRLGFDPGRAVGLAPEAALPTGVGGRSASTRSTSSRSRSGS